MNCRDFLNEFEDRSHLSDAATRHLNDCADCRKTGDAQTRLWQAIERFEPAAAPNDFNFRVKARIAGRKPDDYRAPLFPLLRYVLPLGLVILISAAVVFNSVYFAGSQNVAQIAKTNSQTSIQTENPAIEPASFEQSAANVSLPTRVEKSLAEVSNRKTEQVGNKTESKNFEGETQAAAHKSLKNPQPKTSRNIEKNSGGSQVRASSLPRIFTPKGINPTEPSETLPNAGNTNSITAEQILSLLGIETTLENGKRQVKAIKQNSVAERSRIKVGDWVEAIDGEKLTNEPIRAKTIEGKKLTIVRGTEKLEIPLHN